MDRRLRLQRAREASRGFRAWKREGVVVVLTIPVALLLLPAVGFQSFGVEHLGGVVITALLAAAIFPSLGAPVAPPL